MGSQFITRFGSLERALLESSVNRPLNFDDKREMRALREHVDIGVGRPLITFFRPGKVTLSANRSFKKFTATYNSKRLVLESNAEEFSVEERLYMTYYVRDLPLKDMAEEHEEEVRNGEVHLAEDEEYTGEFITRVMNSVEYFDAEEYVTAAGVVVSSVDEAFLSEVKYDSSSSEDSEEALGDLAEDHHAGVAVVSDAGSVGDSESDGGVPLLATDVSRLCVSVFPNRLPSASFGGVTVLSVEEVLRGDLSAMEGYGSYARHKARVVEPWDIVECGGHGVVKYSDVVESMNFERFFSVDHGIRYLKIGFPSSNAYHGGAAFLTGVLAPKDSYDSHLVRCVTLFGEAYICAIYVAAMARQGWSVSQIAVGKTSSLSSVSIEKAFGRAPELVREYGLFPGSAKAKFRWHVGNLVIRGEKYALKFLSRVFLNWFKPSAVVEGATTHGAVHDYLTKGIGVLNEESLWAVGVLAEYGDALLTAMLYFDCVLNLGKGVTAQSMQSLRSSRLANVSLAALYKTIRDCGLMDEHKCADCFEALSALILLDNGFDSLFDYLRRHCWDVSSVVSDV